MNRDRAERVAEEVERLQVWLRPMLEAAAAEAELLQGSGDRSSKPRRWKRTESERRTSESFTLRRNGIASAWLAGQPRHSVRRCWSRSPTSRQRASTRPTYRGWTDAEEEVDLPRRRIGFAPWDEADLMSCGHAGGR